MAGAAAANRLRSRQKGDVCHTRYCLVCVDVGQYAAAAFVRRLLRHRQFDTEAKRLGTVIRLSQRGLGVWHLHAEEEIHVEWSS